MLFEQQKKTQVNLNNLHSLVIEAVEKPLIELSLSSCNGNQLKAAKLLGINRNTLKKKIDNYKIAVKNRKKPRPS
ncbi:MAG: site-specific DNA inversion stimulation factor [Planctomycetota bacterium]|nr:MAG: site-specific DNA inversion stimulation factor [Planctomycetota bacterium]